jgi:hypothetical protein
MVKPRSESKHEFYVVAAEVGKRVTKEMVRCAIERIAKAAGLAGRVSGWHVGRHTFGTHAAMLGANPWELMTWMGHKRLEETQLYADVARAHGRSVPQTILAAGEKETDPNRRVLAQLSARLALPPKKSGSKVAADESDREVATDLLGSCLVTPPGLEPGISA